MQRPGLSASNFDAGPYCEMTKGPRPNLGREPFAALPMCHPLVGGSARATLHLGAHGRAGRAYERDGLPAVVLWLVSCCFRSVAWRCA